MRFTLSRVTTTVVVGLLVVACTAAPSPSRTPPPSVPAASPSAPADPVESASGSTASPSIPPEPATATLSIHGSARELAERVRMAPGPGGYLFVSIPQAGGSVLALLDRSGRPRPGWPIRVKDTTECSLLLAVDDGSVRVVCDASDLPEPELGENDVRVFAFDAGGRLLPGWPVQLQPPSAGRMIGDELTMMATAVSDVEIEGQPSASSVVVTVSADGAIRRGEWVPTFDTFVRSAVGPDGVAYAVASVSGPDEGAEEVSRITALDDAGERTGWPISLDGTPSRPAFAPDGRTVLTIASLVQRTSRVVEIDAAGAAIAARSAALPIWTATYADTGGCSPNVPQAPLVAEDGTIFIYSALDDTVIALDPSLKTVPGWPYRPATSLVKPDSRYVKEDAFCPGFAVPAVGPDRSLYLPLQARDATVGGSLVAVGPDGAVVPGWPVELRRPGAEFWSVVVGSDGTAYALAVEAESSTTSSASILAIGPDSIVRSRTTIIDP